MKYLITAIFRETLETGPRVRVIIRDGIDGKRRSIQIPPALATSSESIHAAVCAETSIVPESLDWAIKI